VFEQYILPRTATPRENWDNHSNEDQGPVDSLAACRDICMSLSNCVQYSLGVTMRCSTGSTPNLGDASRGTDSGWIHDRMKYFGSNMENCAGKTGWNDY
jgi:hypothetical protein